MPGQSILEQELGQAGSEMGAAMPSSFFTWNFQQYSCTFKWTQGKYLDEGGFVKIDTLELQPQESIPQPPQVMSIITFSGEQFRIQAIIFSGGSNPKYTCHPLAYGT